MQTHKTPNEIKVSHFGFRNTLYCLDRDHHLGFRVVGENGGYLACDRPERDGGCLLFGAAAWRCALRDRRVGWNCQERQERLWSGVNNTRWLILPWVRVAPLARHLLGGGGLGRLMA